MIESPLDIDRYHALSDAEFMATVTDGECWRLLSELLIYPVMISGLRRSSGGYIVQNAEDLKCVVIGLLHENDDSDDSADD